jgi:hypothetical protein
MHLVPYWFTTVQQDAVEKLEGRNFCQTMVRRKETLWRAKGQLISKGNFVFFNSPKKQTKNFCPSRPGQKFEFSSLFLGRIGDLKKTF